jgi:HlyD family secretion protein
MTTELISVNQISGRLPHRLRWMLIAVALPFVLLPGCRRATEPEPLVTVQAEHPQVGPISEHITADAVLAPLAQAAIEPKISAPVHKFYVQRGAPVKAGQLLAVLENKDLTAAALDNKGAYVAAQAAFETTTKAQVPEDTLKAETDLAQAKANLDLNQTIVKNRKQLFAEGAIPGRDLDTAQAALVQAQSAYDSAAKHYESVSTVSAAALKAAQGQLTSAQGKYEGAEALVNFSEIRSPIDGVVTDRPLFAGETATPGTALITVMETRTLLAKAHIGQILTQQMKVGDEAEIHVPGMDESVPAKVSLISPALDPGSTTVEVWLRIDNRSGKLKVGTPVKVAITGKTIAKALKIPSSAILAASDGTKSVMVVGSDGAAHIKPVTVGIQDDDEVQIVSGVGADDMVITSGSYSLDDGTKVKVGPAEGDDADDAKDKGGA